MFKAITTSFVERLDISGIFNTVISIEIHVFDVIAIVFAIVFPSFTGMTAGVGLSGDLEDPGRSIPRGTVAATLAGLLVYVFIAWKLAVSAPPEVLAEAFEPPRRD